jgi:hypothetical protein
MKEHEQILERWAEAEKAGENDFPKSHGYAHRNLHRPKTNLNRMG